MKLKLEKLMEAMGDSMKVERKPSKAEVKQAARHVIDQMELNLVKGYSEIEAAKTLIANLEDEETQMKYMTAEDGDVSDADLIRFVKENPNFSFDREVFNDSYEDMMAELTGEDEEE